MRKAIAVAATLAAITVGSHIGSVIRDIQDSRQYRAEYKANQSEIGRIKAEIENLKAVLENIKITKIRNLTEFIKHGEYHDALSYLNAFRECNMPTYEATIDDVASAAEDVVDNYEFSCACKPDLLAMADAIYAAQKSKAIPPDQLLLGALNDIDTLANFKTHLWVAYNLSLSKTGSVRKTHEELRSFYRNESFRDMAEWPKLAVESYGSMVGDIFKYIEQNTPQSLAGKIETKYADCKQSD